MVFFTGSSGQTGVAIHDWEDQLVPSRHCSSWQRPLHQGSLASAWLPPPGWRPCSTPCIAPWLQLSSHDQASVSPSNHRGEGLCSLGNALCASPFTPVSLCETQAQFLRCHIWVLAELLPNGHLQQWKDLGTDFARTSLLPASHKDQVLLLPCSAAACPGMAAGTLTLQSTENSWA